MRFVLEIECENAAFNPDPEPEVARLLDHVASRLRVFDDAPILVDENGNTVGRWAFVSAQ